MTDPVHPHPVPITDPLEDAVVDSLPAAVTTQRLTSNWRYAARTLQSALADRGYLVTPALTPPAPPRGPFPPPEYPDAACVCNTGPDTDGPEQDCPQHGDVRWYANWFFAQRDLLRKVETILFSDESDDDARRRAVDAIRQEF